MRIAFFGTGLLGAPMALRLHGRGVDVRAWNRTRARTAPLAAEGLVIAEAPADALDESEALVLMLADAPAIREVLEAPDVSTALSGRAVVQMGTIGPPESRALSEWCAAQGADYLEAPVLGSLPQARDGTLQIMVGGTSAQLERWTPLFGHLGTPFLVGPVGQAAALKLALNQLIAALTAAFSASLGLVRREGVDVSLFLEILRASALYAPTFDKKLDRMLDRRFGEPNFPTRHLLKDVDLFLDAARQAGLDTRAVEGVRAVVQAAVSEGWADVDYSALYQAVDPPA